MGKLERVLSPNLKRTICPRSGLGPFRVYQPTTTNTRLSLTSVSLPKDINQNARYSLYHGKKGDLTGESQ